VEDRGGIAAAEVFYAAPEGFSHSGEKLGELAIFPPPLRSLVRITILLNRKTE